MLRPIALCHGAWVTISVTAMPTGLEPMFQSRHVFAASFGRFRFVYGDAQQGGAEPGFGMESLRLVGSADNLRGQPLGSSYDEATDQFIYASDGSGDYALLANSSMRSSRMPAVESSPWFQS
jgi:hypothetical protein